MTKFFTVLAIVATMGAAMLGTAALATADTINAPLGAGMTNGDGYPDWADQALAPKGRGN